MGTDAPRGRPPRQQSLIPAPLGQRAIRQPPMKKTRPEAKIKTLPEEVQGALWEHVTTATDGRERPMTYEEAREWLRDAHGVTTSSAALSYWRGWYGLRRRTERAQARAREATLEWAAQHSDTTTTDLERLGQLVFTAESIEGGDIRAYVDLMRLRLKSEAQDLDARRLAILEDKARQADAARDVLQSTLTPAQQAARLREILK